jgi:hypothetical protein
MNRREVKAELTSFNCPIPLDHTTPELEELLETVRTIPRDEAGKVRKVARRAERFEP